MKKLLIALLLLTATTVQAKNFNKVIPDQDIAAAEYVLIDATAWLDQAWNMKLALIKKQIIREQMEISKTKGEAVPADDDAIVKKFLSSPNYKSRATRDAETEAKIKAMIDAQNALQAKPK